MNKNDYKGSIKSIEKLNYRASKVLSLVNDKKPIDGFQYLEPILFDNEYVGFYGHSFINRVYRQYYYNLPCELLYSKSKLKEYLQNV